jgi:hypothetical protein
MSRSSLESRDPAALEGFVRGHSSSKRGVSIVPMLISR